MTSDRAFLKSTNASEKRETHMIDWTLSGKSMEIASSKLFPPLSHPTNPPQKADRSPKARGFGFAEPPRICSAPLAFGALGLNESEGRGATCGGVAGLGRLGSAPQSVAEWDLGVQRCQKLADRCDSSTVEDHDVAMLSASSSRTIEQHTFTMSTILLTY